MQIKTLVTATTLVASLALTGCATILNEDTQKINVSSSNAKPITGTIDGKAFTGPGVVEVKRAKADKTLVVTTPDCVSNTALTKEVDSKFFINILSGGAFGSTTDYSSEKMWKYQDNVVVQCK